MWIWKKRNSNKFQVTICSHREIKLICSVLEWMDFSFDGANRIIKLSSIKLQPTSQTAKTQESLVWFSDELKVFKRRFQRFQNTYFLRPTYEDLGQSFSSRCTVLHGLWSKAELVFNTSSVNTSWLTLLAFSKLVSSTIKEDNHNPVLRTTSQAL